MREARAPGRCRHTLLLSTHLTERRGCATSTNTANCAPASLRLPAARRRWAPRDHEPPLPFSHSTSTFPSSTPVYECSLALFLHKDGYFYKRKVHFKRPVSCARSQPPAVRARGRRRTVSSICSTLSCSQASSPSMMTTSRVWFCVKLSMALAILAISSTSHLRTCTRQTGALRAARPERLAEAPNGGHSRPPCRLGPPAPEWGSIRARVHTDSSSRTGRARHSL